MTDAPSPTADEARTVWFIVRDPGCYPQRKGPFTQQQVKPFLLELMEARPTAFIEIVTIHNGEIDVQDGPEALEQIDGRYASRARNNREQRRNALSRVPSEEATEEEIERVARGIAYARYRLNPDTAEQQVLIFVEHAWRIWLDDAKAAINALRTITRAPGAGP